MEEEVKIKEVCENMLPCELEKILEIIKNIIRVTIKNKSTNYKLINQEKGNIICPHCNSNNIVKNGHTKTDIQRYKCKSCKKRFNDATNTIIMRSKLTYEKWIRFFECMINKFSIRKTAEILEVNKNTIFAMRQKVLLSLSKFEDKQILSGIVQMDEKYLSINLKGTKKEKMPRASKHRQSKGGSKRGTSSHQVCILSAIDDKDHIYLKIAGSGRPTAEMIEKNFKGKIMPYSRVVIDSNSSYNNFLNKRELKCERIKSKNYINKNGYNLAEINSVHSNLELFLASFRGVSTKHLQGYLDWFRYQKMLIYTYEVLKQSYVMMKFSLVQNNNIKIKDIYSKHFPIDIYNIYSEYNYNPSPII